MRSIKEAEAFEAVFLSREGIHRLSTLPFGIFNLGAAWRVVGGEGSDPGAEWGTLILPSALVSK